MTKFIEINEDQYRAIRSEDIEAITKAAQQTAFFAQGHRAKEVEND